MISELDARLPLNLGMKVIDPSAGSGVFLVQTYRMLIERATRKNGGQRLKPSELGEILTTQIFGVDRDLDACRIAEMSLLVTLLDYVDPPDLEGRYHNFALPTLKGKNIFEADFFDDESDWAMKVTLDSLEGGLDWVIGNPPWKEIKRPFADSRDHHALTWMNQSDNPSTGGNQLAEAFVWKAQPLLREGGVSGLLLPAMTLFKNESKRFRQDLFSKLDVWSVMNFSNLAYVLFSGRANVPVMSLFFGKPFPEREKRDPVLTFSPFVMSQMANRPEVAGRQKNTWNIVVNGADVREIPWRDAREGEGLTWKLAMWGTHHDKRLLEKVTTKFVRLDEFCERNGLAIGQGFELRNDPIGIDAQFQGSNLVVTTIEADGPGAIKGLKKGDQIVSINGRDVSDFSDEEEIIFYLKGGAGKTLTEVVEKFPREFELKFKGECLLFCPELLGKEKVSFSSLRGAARIIGFPEKALSRIPKEKCFVRKEGGLAGFPVSEPPSIILDVSRRFAVLNTEFVVVPARQIGIAGGSESLMEALTLFLQSNFVQFHQFFHATQWGIAHSIATLKVLKALPVPDFHEVVEEWSKEYLRIKSGLQAGEEISNVDLTRINSLVYKALGLSSDECHLIEDFVNVRMLAVKGKFSADAVKAPSEAEEVPNYLATLRDVLDAYMEDESQAASHHLSVLSDGESAMIEIVLREGKPVKPEFQRSNEAEADELERTRTRLLKKHRQWLYVNRRLEIYRDGRLYLFKPFERMQWTRRQAVIDAGELIAEALNVD